MGRHGVISTNPDAGIACWTKLEITPPSFYNHSRCGTLWREAKLSYGAINPETSNLLI
jgi:hypothetical protein